MDNVFKYAIRSEIEDILKIRTVIKILLMSLTSVATVFSKVVVHHPVKQLIAEKEKN